MMSMSIIPAGDVAASGLSAERLRMEIVAQNLANIDTTRGPDGKPYQRKEVVFESVMDQASAAGNIQGANQGVKVKVAEIKNDPRPMIKVYKPGHPDADKNGMVTMPNVNSVEEMADLMTASRSYQADLAVLKTSKQMVNNLIDLGTMK